tara:strand:- start:438 stop:578 length:141 start_codon:yes stop_codon:yes gene_type:complete
MLLRLTSTVLVKLTFFRRFSLEEVLEKDIFFNYEKYSGLLEDSEWL